VKTQAHPTDHPMEAKTNVQIEEGFHLPKNTETIDPFASLGTETLLLIISSNRPDYLKKTLSYVNQYHPRHAVPILISQDGNNPAVNQVICEAQEKFHQISSLSFEQFHFTPVPHAFYENGYFRLADHFKFALNQAFQQFPTVKQIIILEEDLQIAPDFFEYFAATIPLLQSDPNLLTISAWNDNGFRQQVQDPQQLYRSDFFPGLGWVVTRTLWEQELQKKWPRAYWDDWLREPKQRQGRQIIRPEISRTFHFGTHGVSNAQYSGYLNQILLNDQYIHFTSLDLSYLTSVRWDQEYLTIVRQATLLPNINSARQYFTEVVPKLSAEERKRGIRLVYAGFDEHSRQDHRGGYPTFSQLANWSGAMDNVKAGVPRTAYKGIVNVYKEGVRVFLVPVEFT
jgi:alpha-1,3-mannosyl-glycoprotein beta-1,2-N-acetylglucosaminyltransferase